MKFIKIAMSLRRFPALPDWLKFADSLEVTGRSRGEEGGPTDGQTATETV